MDVAAKAYVKALENRQTTRRRPPANVFELQDRIRDYVARMRASRDDLERAVRARRSPTRAAVTRTAHEGVYVAGGKVLVRHGVDGPSVAFWNVAKNSPVYLRRDGRDWKNPYEDGPLVRLDEHWSPGGLR
jgi:hypothetical protein